MQKRANLKTVAHIILGHDFKTHLLLLFTESEVVIIDYSCFRNIALVCDKLKAKYSAVY